MPRPQWKPEEQLTPFARIVRAWMWSQKPPVTVSQLAEISGISKQAAWGWFQHNALPRRDTVLQLARCTGMDVDELLRAAGMPDTTRDESQRRVARRIALAMIQRAIREIRADSRINPEYAEMLVTHVRSLELEMIEAAAAALAREGMASDETEAAEEMNDEERRG